MTDAEVLKYLCDTGMFSSNGVMDDLIFGDADEWYFIDYTRGVDRQPEPYYGPFKSYDEAMAFKANDKPTGYIYTDRESRNRSRRG